MAGIGAVSNVRFVEPTRTPVSPVALREALARAWTRATGTPPSNGILDALTAQAMLETGRGTSMVQYNFGGIKGVGPSGLSTKASTIEVEKGKTIHIVDGFRAYGTLDEGALDYVRLVRGQFGAALARADAGDLDGFAHELKVAHYYTADEKDYAKLLHALAGTPANASTTAALASTDAPVNAPPTPASNFARATDVVRMLDAVRGSMMRIAAPTEDEG
jgi:hypothetical protein